MIFPSLSTQLSVSVLRWTRSLSSLPKPAAPTKHSLILVVYRLGRNASDVSLIVAGYGSLAALPAVGASIPFRRIPSNSDPDGMYTSGCSRTSMASPLLSLAVCPGLDPALLAGLVSLVSASSITIFGGGLSKLLSVMNPKRLPSFGVSLAAPSSIAPFILANGSYFAIGPASSSLTSLNGLVTDG